MSDKFRILAAALLVAFGIAGGALACNEECTSGFVFNDDEGVCVRAVAGTA